MKKVALAAIYMLALTVTAQAQASFYGKGAIVTAYHGHGRHFARGERASYGAGTRPHLWCGWYVRQLVGSDPGPDYNLAKNWAHWGHPSGPCVGCVAVGYGHVGKIVGRNEKGEWIVQQGNPLRYGPDNLHWANLGFRSP